MIVSPPANGSMGMSQRNDPTEASIVVFGGTQPLVMTERDWGPIVKSQWWLNDFGTSRNIAFIEVLETDVPSPADSGSPAPAGTRDQARPESTSSVDHGEIVGASGRRYRRVPGGLTRY